MVLTAAVGWVVLTDTPIQLDAAAPPDIDFVRLRDLTDGDETAMRSLVDVYLQETALELERLAIALRSQDATEVHRLAHGCKGASQNYGMAAIARIFQTLETQAPNNLDHAARTFRQAQAAFQAVQSAWAAHLTQPPNQQAM